MKVVLPREPDAAVQLQPVLHHQALAVAGRRLRHGHGDGPALVLFGDGQGGEGGQRGGPLEQHVHLDQTVLEGLEGPDGPAVLLAVLGVLEGGLEDGAARPDGAGRQAHRGLLDRPADGSRRPGAARRGQHPLRPDPHPLEGELGERQAGIDDRQVAAGHGAARNDEDAQTVLAGGALRSGHHCDLVRPGSVDDPRLAPLQHPAVPVRAGGGGHQGRLPAAGRRLGQGQRAGRPPLGDGAEVGGGHLGIGHLADHGCEEGTGRGNPPELLDDQAQLDEAEPQPAVLLRDGERGPVEGGHLLPQRPRGRVVLALLGLEDLPDQRRRAGLAQDGAHAVAQLLLFVGGLEVHG